MSENKEGAGLQQSHIYANFLLPIVGNGYIFSFNRVLEMNHHLLMYCDYPRVGIVLVLITCRSKISLYRFGCILMKNIFF